MKRLIDVIESLGVDKNGTYASPRGDVIADLWKFFPNVDRRTISTMLSQAKKRGYIDKPNGDRRIGVTEVTLLHDNIPTRIGKRGRPKVRHRRTKEEIALSQAPLMSKKVDALEKQVKELIVTVTELQRIASRDQATYAIEKSQSLTVLEREVLSMRFGFEAPPMTLEQVSEVLGIPRQKVRQIEARAMQKAQA